MRTIPSTSPSLLSRVLLSLSLSLCTSAWAASGPSDEPNFKSGGIGQEEVHAMRQAAGNYSVGLTFASPSGEYLADVDVCIRDSHGGEVLSTVTDGPILLVDLPAGRYTVEAEYDGRTLKRDVSVPAKGHRELTLHI